MWFENTVITVILLLAVGYVGNQVGLLHLGKKSKKSSCKGCSSGGCHSSAEPQGVGEHPLPMRQGARRSQ